MSDRDKQCYVEIGFVFLVAIAVHWHWNSVLIALAIELYFITLARFGKSY